LNAPIHFDTDEPVAATEDSRALRDELIAAGVVRPKSEERQEHARRARCIAAGMLELDDFGRRAAACHIREGDFGRRELRHRGVEPRAFRPTKAQRR
jgi:hypothetical protein